MIELKANEKMDLEEHYPQNTKSHCIIRIEFRSNCTIFSVEFGLVRSDLALVILKTRTCLLTLSFF